MQENKHLPRLRQRGAAALEFALLAIVFFTLVFGVIEVARVMFVYNTLQEVTRRAASAASNVYALDAAGLQKVREYAIFRDSPGTLMLASQVSDASIRIDYLALKRDPVSNELALARIDQGSLPSCSARNRQICMRDPNADNCIRFVQASVCAASNTEQCVPVAWKMLIPMLDVRFDLHRATTITPAESLGYRVGMSPCP